jgi:hypothetical protein
MLPCDVQCLPFCKLVFCRLELFKHIEARLDYLRILFDETVETPKKRVRGP